MDLKGMEQKGMPKIRSIQNFWQWLTQPAIPIQEPAQRRQSLLLAYLLFIFFIISLTVLVIILSLLDPARAEIVALGLVIVFLTIAYGLNRAGYYSIAAILTLTVISASIFL